MFNVEFRCIIHNAGTLHRTEQMPFVPFPGMEIVRPDQSEGTVERIGWDREQRRVIAWLESKEPKHPETFVPSFVAMHRGWGWEWTPLGETCQACGLATPAN